MNVLLCSINTLKGLYDRCGSRPTSLLANRGFPSPWPSTSYFFTSWIVIAILLGSATIAVRNPQTIPTGGQNFFEYALEFIRDVSQTQIGEEYGPWVPFIGTMFLFLFVSNWSGLKTLDQRERIVAARLKGEERNAFYPYRHSKAFVRFPSPEDPFSTRNIAFNASTIGPEDHFFK